MIAIPGEYKEIKPPVLRRVAPTQRDGDLLQTASVALESFKQTGIFHFLEVSAAATKELYERNL